MRSNKPYTNATFTKRVDHDAGRHRPERALPEPAVCFVCGDVYADRRWSRPERHAGSDHPHFRPPHLVVCPGCSRQRSGVPGGYLYIEGEFAVKHHGEIERLVTNEATRALKDNPLARLMGWERDQEGRVTVTTTTEHLAQRLGHAVAKAFDGEIRYDFSHENKLARVYWRRDS